MATQVVSSLVNLLVEKLSSSAIQKLGEIWKIREDVHRLDAILKHTQAYLRDAGDRRIEGRGTLALWLEEVEGLATMAEEVVDVFDYYDIRERAVSSKTAPYNPQHMLDRFAGKHIKAYKTSKLSGKIKEIEEKFEVIVKLKACLGEAKYEPAREEETGSMLIGDPIGRESEMDRAMKWLHDAVDGVEGLPTLVIVGQGGMGKTTLAQLIYSRATDLFDLFLWVHASVSDNDATRLYQKLLLSAGESRKGVNTVKDVLQQNLKSRLFNKRYLLVLDNLWDVDEGMWEEFCALLKVGGGGRVAKL